MTRFPARDGKSVGGTGFPAWAGTAGGGCPTSSGSQVALGNPNRCKAALSTAFRGEPGARAKRGVIMAYGNFLTGHCGN